MKGTPGAPRCGFSANVIQMLQHEGVADIHGVDVLADPAVREGAKIFSDWPTFPQVYINGEFVGGRDILFAMFQSGELKTLLASTAGKQ